jgi:hypothetical protein
MAELPDLMSKSELDPWRVICGHLFELDSYYIPEIIDKTGMAVDWFLTEIGIYIIVK